MLRTRIRPRWLSRNVILAADAIFGLVLIAVGVGGRLFGGAAAVAPSGPSQTPSFEIPAQFGGLHPPGQTTGFAVARDGSMAVVDRGRQVVIHLSGSGKPQAEWGPNFGPGVDAKDLVGVAADGEGWAMLDRGALRILRLNAQGQAQPDRTIDLTRLETYGPNGLASDGHDNLYMADTGRDRVVTFNASGVMTGSFGDAGTDLGKFKQPMTVAFAPDGSFFVADWENARIQRFGADRTPSNAWPLPFHAWGVAVDTSGRVFVPDGDHKLVRMFGPDGSQLAQLGDQSSPLPLDAEAQVGVSPDGGALWLLGNRGLVRVDLTPYAALRPSAAGQPARTPLAVLGGVLLLIAGLSLVWPGFMAPKRPRSARRAPATQAPVTVRAEPVRAVTGTGRPTLIASALITVGIVGAVVAEVAVAHPLAKLDPWPRMGWLVADGLVFAIGAILSTRALPWQWVSAWPCFDSSKEGAAEPWWRMPRTTLASLGLIVIFGAAAAIVWWQGRFQTPDATRGAFVWLAALVLTLGTLTARVNVRRPNVWAVIPWAVFAIALIPRVWHNADLPFGVWYDEAEAGLQARKFAQSGLYTPITDTYGRDASLFYYFMAAAQGLLPDPVMAGRLVAAIVGAACAPLMYFLGRELFGWRVGLVAGLLMATQRWQLDVSRLGWDPISLPFFAILAFWLLARAIRTARWSDAVWAGLAIGLGLHGYIGYRVLPLVGVVLLLYGGWLQRWRPVPFAGRVGVIAISAVLTALPVLIFAIQDPAGFNGRLIQTLILNEAVSQAQKLDEIWSNLQKHLLMFHISGDMNGRHNLPGLPMLDPLSGLLFVIGLATLAVRPLDWRSWLVFGWAVVSVAGGVMTFPYEAPQAMRSLGATPVLALVIAFALVLVIDRAAVVVRLRPRMMTATASAVAAVSVGWIGLVNLYTFFGPQMNDPTVWESFSTRETLPSRAAQAAVQPYEAILGSPIIAPTLQQQLMVPRIQNTIRPFDAATDLPYRGNGPGLIVLESEHDAGLADEVARYYPDAARWRIVPPNGVKPTADELLLDRSVITAHRGLAAGRANDGTWRVIVGIDALGAYAFRETSGLRVSVDETPLSTGQAVQLSRGNHLVALSGASDPAATPQLTWMPPGATDWQPIDERLIFAAPEGGNGLEATFYSTIDFQGSPTDTMVDPVIAHYFHVNPLARVTGSAQSWSVEWNGSIEVPTTGAYRFEAERLSRAGLWIDDAQVFDDTADGASPTQSGSAQLSAGRHQIRVRLQNRGDGGPRLYLNWTPPGGGRELVPGRVLYPPPPR